jgi:hypothetical protein
LGESTLPETKVENLPEVVEAEKVIEVEHVEENELIEISPSPVEE